MNPKMTCQRMAIDEAIKYVSLKHILCFCKLCRKNVEVALLNDNDVIVNVPDPHIIGICKD